MLGSIGLDYLSIKLSITVVPITWDNLVLVIFSFTLGSSRDNNRLSRHILMSRWLYSHPAPHALCSPPLMSQVHHRGIMPLRVTSNNNIFIHLCAKFRGKWAEVIIMSLQELLGWHGRCINLIQSSLNTSKVWCISHSLIFIECDRFGKGINFWKFNMKEYHIMIRYIGTDREPLKVINIRITGWHNQV